MTVGKAITGTVWCAIMAPFWAFWMLLALLFFWRQRAPWWAEWVDHMRQAFE